jgi:hypothetical protein
MRAILVGSIALLLAGSARADMLPEGEKGVALSIRVDAEVPAGKALVLINTFRGADIIKPNEVQKVEWHPLAGAMQLRVIDKTKAAAIEAARENLDRDKVQPLIKSAIACGETFQGIRTIAETSPAEEVRWNFRVSIAGRHCNATLASTEYFDKAGKVVDPKATAPTAEDMREPIPPPKPPGAPADPPPPVAAPPPAAPAPPAPPAKPAAPANTGGCSVGEPVAAVPGLLLALLLLRRRRAR